MRRFNFMLPKLILKSCEKNCFFKIWGSKFYILLQKIFHKLIQEGLPQTNEPVNQIILSKVQECSCEDYGCIIWSFDNHYIYILEFKSLASCSCLQLPKELINLAKDLMHIKCFRWCHIRRLNPMKKWR